MSLLLLLQTRGRMTAQELAEELEVSVRTVYRDVESLGAAGVPVYADRGPLGGYQLLAGYRTRLTGLTADEAESLFLAGAPGPAAELGLGSVLAAAQLKLMAALPPELRSRAGRISERFHLDVPGWFKSVERPPHLSAIADAVWNARLIEIRYRRWGRTEVVRTLEPLGLVLKNGTWYLIARPPDGEPRTYRISRVLALEVRPNTFERPDAFDLASFWAAYSEEFQARLYPEEATVRMSPLAYDLVGYYLGAAVARRVRETATEQDEDGWRQATVPIESLAHARLELFRFGNDLEVLEPPELRALMAETATAVHAIYH